MQHRIRPSAPLQFVAFAMCLTLAVSGCSGSGTAARTVAPRPPPSRATTTTAAPSSTTTSTTTTPQITSAPTTSTAPTTDPAPVDAPRPAAASPPVVPQAPITAVPLAPPPPRQLIDQIADLGGASKVITVRSAGWSSTAAELMAWERVEGTWKLVMGPWTANVGWAGWAWQPGESTGRSPIGVFSFGSGFGLAADPGYSLGWFVVGPRDYWVEDPSSPQYNTHQQADPGAGPKLWNHFERLIDYPLQYEYSAMINFNVPARPGIGSGIFLHVSTGGNTAGCVALPRGQLLSVLRWIDMGTRIVMGPDDVIRSL